VTSEMKSPLGPPIQATRNRIEMNPAAKIQPRVCLVPQFGICNRHSLLILVGWDFVRYPGASEISRASASNRQASPSSFCSKIESPPAAPNPAPPAARSGHLSSPQGAQLRTVKRESNRLSAPKLQPFLVARATWCVHRHFSRSFILTI
jgi:hypothetical protein